MDLIKSLYWGNICPTDYVDSATIKNPEYKKVHDEFSAIYEKVENSLSKDMYELFNQAIDAHTVAFAMQDEEAFKAGFILGVKLMCECLCKEKM